MTFDAATMESIKASAKLVLEHSQYQAKRADATDIPEYLALEIIDLVEWCSDNPDLHSPVAKLVLDSGTFPQGVRLPVCRHFNLPY